MVVQLPTGALGAAIWALIYSLLCLTCSSVMIWLVWAHHERDSYVALLSYFTFLGTATSISQQIHTIIWWSDIKSEQFEHVAANIGCPEIAIAGPSVGVDLVLFYIQYYCYNVEAMLTLFWAGALTKSVFKFEDLTRSKGVRRRMNIIARSLAILTPILLLSLLRLDSVQSSLPAFLILANIAMVISLTGGSILLIVILAKYIYTRRRLLPWNVRYPSSRPGSQDLDPEALCALDDGERRHSIYDRWLVMRFSIAFVLIGTFQIITILSEVAQLQNHTREALGEMADLSMDRAKIDFILFMPGVSTSLLVFVVFGTTRTFREYMYRTFIPRKLQRKAESTAPSSTVDHRGSKTKAQLQEQSNGADNTIGLKSRDGDSRAESSVQGGRSSPTRRTSTESMLDITEML